MSGHGTVAAVHGRRALVDADYGGLRSALLAARRLQPVCGDRVALTGSGENLRITAIEPRAGRLWRHDNRRGRRLLAANVDDLAIVVAPRPRVRPEQIDRYLAVAELLGLSALLVRNKADLADAALDAELDELGALGYSTVIADQAATGALAEALTDRVAALVGLSGVGKSTLIDRLVPDHELRTAELSAASGEGRHTTTTTRLYRLPGGGAVIDSPGVRDIRLWPMTADELAAGFRELRPYLGTCRFRDCRHGEEPGCALRQAAADGAVSARRYASFRELAMRLAGEAAGAPP